MKKKQFLTEAKRKEIIADKEKVIIESFAKMFNKIKRLDENEITESRNIVFTIGDWFDVSNYDSNKGGVSGAYNKNFGLILAIYEVNGVSMVELAPRITERDANKFIYEPKIYSMRTQDLLKASKDGIEIKYEPSKANENLQKIKSSEYNQKYFGGRIDTAIKIEENSSGYSLSWRRLGTDNGKVTMDVSPLF